MPRDEHRYYRRVTTRAATRCWGLALALGTAVPLAGQTTPSPSPKPPALPEYEFAWQADLGSSGPISIAVGTSMVFVAGGDEPLVAFTTGEGRKAWTATTAGAGATLTAAAGLLCAVTPSRTDDQGRRQAGRLDVLDQADGRAKWAIDALSDPIVGPVVERDTLIVANGADLRAYSAHDGFLSWRTALDAPAVALAADGGALFVALADRTLLRLDIASHAVSWRTSLESAATAIVAANRKVFVCAEDGALWAYHQERRGPPIWHVARTEAVGAPAVDHGRVYVAQFDNTARAYDAGNGTERWRVRLGSLPRDGVQVAGPHVFIPLLSGAMATCVARAGRPSGEILLSAPAGDQASTDRRLAASALTPDASLIFRVSRPSGYTAWTLTAVRRK